MDAFVWVFAGILAIVLVVVAVLAFVLLKKRNAGETKEIDYQVFFVLGISFFPLGFIFMVLSLTSDFPREIGIAFLAIGAIYITLGLSKRNKWKRNK
jgi:Ca2+/Na+ antiporter